MIQRSQKKKTQNRPALYVHRYVFYTYRGTVVYGNAPEDPGIRFLAIRKVCHRCPAGCILVRCRTTASGPPPWSSPPEQLCGDWFLYLKNGKQALYGCVDGKYRDGYLTGSYATGFFETLDFSNGFLSNRLR